MQMLKIWKRSTGATGRLSFLLLCGVLLGGIGAMSATAQSSDPSSLPSKGWSSASSSSGEITVLATIRQVVSEHVAGSPAVVHILIDGPLGSFDASLGSYLTNEVRQALSNGESVQITGVVRSANGKDYLFARQLSIAGHLVIIRNSNGFLVHTPPSSDTRSNKVHSDRNGGIQ